MEGKGRVFGLVHAGFCSACEGVHRHVFVLGVQACLHIHLVHLHVHTKAAGYTAPSCGQKWMDK